jgi:hypothetical protein
MAARSLRGYVRHSRKSSYSFVTIRKLLTLPKRYLGTYEVSDNASRYIRPTGDCLRRLYSTTREPWRSVILACGHRSHAAR